MAEPPAGAHEKMNEQQPNPVFVVGVFRSGTSLLYALLNQHPKIGLMYEGNVLDFPEALGKFRLTGDWLARQEFYNKALSRHRLMNGNGHSVLEEVRCPGDLYRTFGRLKDAQICGEKSPFYPLRLKQLAHQHPGCAMILIWREPHEIYQSVLRAGRTSPFFGRRGMLDRTIYYQEQMIRQAADLDRAGVPMHHVTYDELVGDTEKVCRELCRFLGLEFHGAMLDLGHADFFPVNAGPHHEHLRRGVISKQRYPDDRLPSSLVKKLARYQARWSRLSLNRIPAPPDGEQVSEPSPWERLHHTMTGIYYCKKDVLIRLGFEFLPLGWLRAYRRMKNSSLARKCKSDA